jgi:cytochrome c556
LGTESIPALQSGARYRQVLLPILVLGGEAKSLRRGEAMKLVILAAFTSFAVAGVATAEGYDPIETRQAGQDLVSADFAGIRAVVVAKGDVKSLVNPAKAIARWIRQFPTQFPKGSEQGHNTRARSEIWADFADFQQRANNLADAADKLAQLANAGDAAGVAAQLTGVSEACSACHRTYRSGPY